MPQDVIELLDQLVIPQAIFVGTSLGGLVTMTIAAMDPQRIAAAILNDIGPEIDDAGLDRIKTYVGTRRALQELGRSGRGDCAPTTGTF